MFKKTLAVAAAALTLSGAVLTTIRPAEARGFGGGGIHGGGFGGRGIAVGEPNPGMPHHGGFHHHGGWGHGFGWYGVGFSPFYGCYTRRFTDDFGNVIVRRVCD